MDSVGLQKSESMSTDADADVPYDGSVPSSLPLPDHPTSLDGYPLMAPSPPSPPANVLQETRSVFERVRGLTRQRRNIFCVQPSILQPTTRKRRHSDDTPRPDIMGHDNALGDGSNLSRRIRPRLQGQEVREFSPLLIMSPPQGPPMEETISAFQCPPSLIGLSHSSQRYFYIGNPPEHGPSILQNSSPPGVDDLAVHMESNGSSSANSSERLRWDPRCSRLSSLQDFELPRPFEETKQPSSSGGPIHERGLEARRLFPSTRPGRTGTSEPMGSPRSATSTFEMGPARYFDEPLCESPDSIDADDSGLRYPELPTTQTTQTEHDAPGSTCSLYDGRQ